METKELGARHGAAIRQRLDAAKAAAQAAGIAGLKRGEQAAGYLAGFAQGLLRRDNALPNA